MCEGRNTGGVPLLSAQRLRGPHLEKDIGKLVYVQWKVTRTVVPTEAMSQEQWPQGYV